ncbi:MAG: PEP-CTERM sorting domain-containing protein [Akkermansiaceae bacterium]
MKKLLQISSVVMITSVSASAASLAVYNFENATNRNEDSANLINATDLVNAGNQNNSVPAVDYYNGTRGGQHANALNTAGLTDFVSWTTAGLAGENITYENVSAFFGSNGGSFTPALSYEIGAGSSVAAGTGTTPALQTFNQQTFNFADFTTDETVTWTITFTKVSGGNDRLRFDDLTVTGTVVPEPSSTALLGLGGLALIARRRRG